MLGLSALLGAIPHRWGRSELTWLSQAIAAWDIISTQKYKGIGQVKQMGKQQKARP